MKKFLFHIVNGVSWAFLLLVLGCCIRSNFFVASDRFRNIWLADDGTHYSGYRQIYVCTSSFDVRFSYTWNTYIEEMSAGEMGWSHQVVVNDAWAGNLFLVNRIYPEQEVSTLEKLGIGIDISRDYVDFTLPYWIMALCFGMLPIGLPAWKRLRRYRANRWNMKYYQRELALGNPNRLSVPVNASTTTGRGLTANAESEEQRKIIAQNN